MAHKTVGVNSSFAISGTSAQSAATVHQSEFLRFVAVGASAHVAIGTNPTATTQDYIIPSGAEATLAIGIPASQRVVGVTTGTTTTIDFPEGTGSPFAVGDAVSLTITGSQSYHNFTHKIVTSVNTSSSYDGYFSTRIVVDHNSSGILTSYSAPVGNSTYGELRGSFKVAALGSGSGTIHFQQVQVAGQA